jgi:DNA-binding NtrC family response regulator
LKILVVDDEQLDLFITKKLLGLNFEVHGFNNIPEASAWAKANPFDVLLSDYYLGQGKHAPDVLNAIRIASPNNFRALVLSNHISDDQADALKQAGFDSIIEKPITLEKFTAALKP